MGPSCLCRPTTAHARTTRDGDVTGKREYEAVAREEGVKEEEAGGGTKRRNRRKQPVIVLQSPLPFSMSSTGKGVINREESTASYETSNDTLTSATVETIDNAETKSQSATSAETASDNGSAKINADMDLAHSKTALFGLSVIFHTLSNSPHC